MSDANKRDDLECPRCDGLTKPGRISRDGSTRYRHNCGDGIVYGWTINPAGEITRETQTSD